MSVTLWNNDDNTLRSRVVRNVLKRTSNFTSSQVSRATRVSTRHTRRVLSELVRSGDVIRTTNTTYQVV